MQNRPDLRAAQQASPSPTASTSCRKQSQTRCHRTDQLHAYSVQRYLPLRPMQLPIFGSQPGRGSRAAGYAIAQAQSSSKSARGSAYRRQRRLRKPAQQRGIVTLYRTGYLDEAQQDRDISEYAYRHGRRQPARLLDAERSYRSVQLGYRQALSSYLLAVEQLREAAGTRSLP